MIPPLMFFDGFGRVGADDVACSTTTVFFRGLTASTLRSCQHRGRTSLLPDRPCEAELCTACLVCASSFYQTSGATRAIIVTASPQLSCHRPEHAGTDGLIRIIIKPQHYRQNRM